MNTSALVPTKLELLPTTNSLQGYLNQIKNIPVLDVLEEQTLALNFYEHKNLEAAKQLVLSNLRFVVYIAQGYSRYGLPIGDLIQEGNVGLMKAVKRFNPNMGVRLISFAVHWIKAEIQEFILRNWSIVKVATTKAKRKLFFNLRKLKKNLGWATHQEVNAIAKDLNIKPQTVREMEMHLTAKDVSLESSINENRQDDATTNNYIPLASFSDSRYDPSRIVEDNDFSQWSTQSLQQAMHSLEGKSLEIIKTRWLQEPKAKLKDLAARYNLSIERIRQLEENALLVLRRNLEKSFV